MTQEPTPRRASHLMDPTKPRVAPSAEDVARLQRVQRWVLSVLVATTILHLAAGLVIAAFFIDDDMRVEQMGLCVLAGAFGVCALAAAFAIHRRSLASPWLVLGILPGVIGVVLILA